ncbi:MAG: bifunctional riboflavin kinase/FAD synthetase [Clostridia bacterium]|nr:bifunctional riboflavin kinase/FAD synthetase [Clostridia bacterium]
MVDNNGCVVALGNFDGLHKGHRRVVSTAVEKAAQSGLKAVVLLFDSHPGHLLGREAPTKLMTASGQEKNIRQMGADCVRIEFSRIMNMECEDFVKDVLIAELNAKILCCGFNYHFGKGGRGSVETLSEIAENEGLELYVEDALCYKDEPISSSRIRDCISKGNMADANAMLGESFSYDFEVVGGDRIGRNLGAPTINQHFEQGFIVPLSGVYTSKTYVDGKCYSSITNIGVRPTLDKSELRSETYIIDFSGDLYGRKIRVELLKYIRSEKKFSSLEELKQQIKTDCRIAKDEVIMEKIKVKAIFFDFDDTLQSRQGAYRLYCEAFMDKYFPGVEGEKREKMLNEMEEYVDGGYKDREDYFPELIELWGWDDHPPMQELYDSFNNDYGKYVVMLPHALDVLEEIKQRGYTMGIISNGVSVLQNTKLDTAGIRDMFDVITVSGDFGVYKPDRRIFDEACRQAGFSNEECLFIGDHPINDIQGALGADMKAVRMNQGDFYNKDIDSNIPTIEDLRELLELI